MRLDYYDVIVALEEENYFRKVCRWHEERGMTYGCDHGSRGYDVVEFGDYMRTQKYNQGPGCDQPGLASDIIKNKVAASIAHLHHRPRVWLEGFYGSGWGTTSTQLTDAIARNYVMGQNLLSLHGLYYSTHGGWWEWAHRESLRIHSHPVQVGYRVRPDRAGMVDAPFAEWYHITGFGQA